MLQKLVELTENPVYETFDCICCVHTDAVLAFMLELFHIPLVENQELYWKLESVVSSKNVMVGAMDFMS